LAAAVVPQQLAPAAAVLLLRRPVARFAVAFLPSLPLGAASTGPSGGVRKFCDDKVPKWHARYPHRYFDFKAFRQALKAKKESLTEAELREIRREYAPPPPEGWTVLDFLQKIKFGDGAEDVAALFEKWGDFISMSSKDVFLIPDISHAQRRKVARYITLFNHGLWPKSSPDEFYERFGGKPLQRESEPWTDKEDTEFLEMLEVFDVNFGDPWIYLSWLMQRREDELRSRYIELVLKPRERASRCELAITRSSRPLLMNRKFRMIPTDLYIVPSEQNFPLAESSFRLPAAFEKYRQGDVF